MTMNMRSIISIQRPNSSKSRDLRPRQRRCFYEPLIICITMAAISQTTTKQRPRSPNPSTSEERFYRFLDKLASMCDRDKGGASVTGLAVVELEEAFVYVFGCNDVSDPGLVETAEFVAALLRKLSGVRCLKHVQKDATKKEVLDMLVWFNRPKIEKYFGFLRGDLVDCIKACSGQEQNNQIKLEACLRELQRSIGDITLEDVDRAEYLDSCLRFFREINTFRKTSPGKSLDNVAAEDHLPDHTSMACWSELRHHLSRLIAYERTVTTFVDAEAEWPELFQEFKIWPISSSTRGDKPLGKKSETAHSIIGRMTTDTAKMARYEKLTDELQREPYSLDARIQKQCNNRYFKPLVHGEVLVLDWIFRRFHGRPPLFQGYQYVGTSKGACKLCEYYFHAHPSKIRARPSHGNVYANWDFPQVLEADGDGAYRRRQNIFNSMNASIRNDAFKVLEERSASGKRHDSNTYALASGQPGTTDAGVGGSDISDAEELIEQFEADLSFGSASTNTDKTRKLSDSDDDDDEEEGGGATLR